MQRKLQEMLLPQPVHELALVVVARQIKPLLTLLPLSKAHEVLLLMQLLPYSRLVH